MPTISQTFGGSAGSLRYGLTPIKSPGSPGKRVIVTDGTMTLSFFFADGELSGPGWRSSADFFDEVDHAGYDLTGKTVLVQGLNDPDSTVVLQNYHLPTVEGYIASGTGGAVDTGASSGGILTPILFGAGILAALAFLNR
jgi:hypothetical protein